jgi:formate dehydrogenase beta subunit
LAVERVSRNSRPHLRPALRTRLPSRTRRGKPVAICRLKRVAADNKDDVSARMPHSRSAQNGKRVACIGAGPASLTVARDLAPLGYDLHVFDGDPRRPAA